MRRAGVCVACLLGGVAAGLGEPAVVPRPAVLTEEAGTLVVAPGAAVAAPQGEAPLYAEVLSQAAGFPIRPGASACALRFEAAERTPSGVARPQGEGYALRVSPEGATVWAATEAGRFYGAQTLAQLLRMSPAEGRSRLLPGLSVSDAPRFAWRGYMLDEARSFSGEEAVKRLLDAMASYKLNRLHWHLTDSPGWRLEIKAYPRLTEVGGRGDEHDRRPDAPAQFYTQAQVREIVAYARARHIAVVPEIDMPGHADAAVLAYPALDGGGFLQKGRTDKWPHFTFNPARPETLAFLDTVLAEVAGLFPEAGMIHFGGDEVHFGWKQWSELPEVQALMAKEGLHELADVEAWFNRRQAGTINRLGLKTGGWDEIAARGLPADKTVIFWWRHDKPQVLRAALDAGYPVVLCPRRPCYFDFVQHESHQVGRRWGGFNPLADVYAFPRGLALSAADESRVLGVQACLWTETTATQARRDFLTWPRLLALAEAAWTPDARKDFGAFEARLRPQLDALRARGIGFYDPLANTTEVTDGQGGQAKAHLD